MEIILNFFRYLGDKIVSLKVNEKLEDKKLENAIKLEKAKKELNQTDKDFINDLILILGKLDKLKTIQNKIKSGTGIILQIPGGEKREIKKLTKEEIENFTKIVSIFKQDIYKWKEIHNALFINFNENTKNAWYKIDNFFSHNHEKYSEQDFIKIFERRNKFILSLKEELKK